MVEKMFYTMGEISEMFDVNQSLIRHWEKQFSVLRPKRNKKGNRLFSPQDVERLKLIYHLVKERGMTLDGARKALRQHRDDNGVPRDVELMERLQRIRSLLVEVREDLKEGQAGVYTADGVENKPPVASKPKPAPEESTPEEPVAEQPTLEEESVVEQPFSEEEPMVEQPTIEEEPAQQEQSAEQSSGRKPRRKKDDDDNHELFAFYEQSLF